MASSPHIPKGGCMKKLQRDGDRLACYAEDAQGK